MRINLRAVILLLVDSLIFGAWLLIEDHLLLGIFIALFVFILIEALITIITIRGVQLIRKSRTNRHVVGETFHESFVVKNNSKLRKYLIQIIDHSKIGAKINSRVITNFPGKGIRSFNSSAVLLNRGRFPLGPTTIRAESVFGLFSINKNFPAKKQLIVFPHIISFDKQMDKASVDMGGKNLWTYSSSSTPQIAGIREYYPGDPLHRVHWPLSLKHGNLMVKEFDQDSRTQTWILLDSRESKGRDSKEIIYAKKTPYMTLKRAGKNIRLAKNSFEYAVSAAASLANHYINKGISVGFMTFGKSVINIQPDSGQRQLYKILNELASIERSGTVDIIALFNRMKSQIPKGGNVFLITDDKKTPFDGILEIAALKKIQLFPIFIDEASFNIPIEDQVKKQKVPLSKQGILTIRYGDDLKKVLEK